MDKKLSHGFEMSNDISEKRIKYIPQSANSLPERKKFAIHIQCRKDVTEKEQNEALTNAVRNREFGDFSVRVLSGMNNYCEIL